MSFIRRAGSPFVLSMAGCVSLLLLGAYLLLGDEHSSPEESPAVASETSGAAFEPPAAGATNQSVEQKPLAIRLTKPRSGPLITRERPPSDDEHRAAEPGSKGGWDNSEVGHGSLAYYVLTTSFKANARERSWPRWPRPSKLISRLIRLLVRITTLPTNWGASGLSFDLPP
jgi:hypothetical protein